MVEDMLSGGPGAGAAAQVAERLARLQRLTATMSQAVTVEDVAIAAVTTTAAELSADAVFVHLLDAGTRMLEAAAHTGVDPDVAGRWASVHADADMPVPEALRQGKVVSFASAHQRDAAFPALKGTATQHDAYVIAPMSVNGEPIGVVSCGFDEPRRIDAGQEAFVQAVADQCAQAVHRARLYDFQQKAYAAQRFLAEAAGLLADSLDYALTLERVAALAVPTIADICGVCVVDADGDLRPVAAAHADADRQEILDRLAARQPVLRSPALLEVLASGHPRVMPAVRPEQLAQVAQDAAHLGLLHALAPTSGIIVGLRARGQTLGLLILLSADGKRRLDADDLPLAQDLAAQAALAIDNARMHAERSKLADQLQAALSTRVVIEQAKGILAERHGVSIAEAFEGMRTVARGQGSRIHDLAAEVVGSRGARTDQTKRPAD